MTTMTFTPTQVQGDSPAQAQYQNKLEQWYNSCPGPVKKVLNVGNAYKTVNGWLKKVAGDPDKIVSYGPKYVALGSELDGIAQEVMTISAEITNWSGESYVNFRAKTTDFADKVAKVAKAVAGTQEILVACAKGCVEVANCICDLVMMFVKFLIKSYLAALASSSFTFGGSIVAWISANIAKAIQMVNKVITAIAKFSKFIDKIITLIKKVMEVIQKIQKIINVIKGVFAAFKAFKNGDVLGGLSALTGAVQGYNSLTGGGGPDDNSTLTKIGNFGQDVGTIAGGVKGISSGDPNAISNAVGGLAKEFGADPDTVEQYQKWAKDGTPIVTDAQGAWSAMKEAREAAERNAPPKM